MVFNTNTLNNSLSTQLSSHNTLSTQTPDTILHFKQVTASNIVHNIQQNHKTQVANSLLTKTPTTSNINNTLSLKRLYYKVASSQQHLT